MSVECSENDFADDVSVKDDGKREFCNLKLKYAKQQPNLLDGKNVKLPKYKSKNVLKLKQKYIVKTSIAHIPFDFLPKAEHVSNKSAKELISDVNKTSKIVAKRSKKKNLPDPEVSNISDLMYNNLLIESPDKMNKDQNESFTVSKIINEDNLDSDLLNAEENMKLSINSKASKLALYEFKTGKKKILDSKSSDSNENKFEQNKNLDSIFDENDETSENPTNSNVSRTGANIHKTENSESNEDDILLKSFKFVRSKSKSEKIDDPRSVLLEKGSKLDVIQLEDKTKKNIDSEKFDLKSKGTTMESRKSPRFTNKSKKSNKFNSKSSENEPILEDKKEITQPESKTRNNKGSDSVSEEINNKPKNSNSTLAEGKFENIKDSNLKLLEDETNSVKQTEIKTEKIQNTKSKHRAIALKSKLSKENDSKGCIINDSKLGESDPTSKVSHKNVNNQSSETPQKINAFAFMMGSRNKIIGTNSDGRDIIDELTTSPEEFKQKKQKLDKRKQIFENWAENKVSSTKRKLEDEAQERFINRTLTKRAKRMKKMLNINDENQEKNYSNDCEIIKAKKIRNRKFVLIDSESSNDAIDTKEISSNITNPEITEKYISDKITNPNSELETKTINEISGFVNETNSVPEPEQDISSISDGNKPNSALETEKTILEIENKSLEISDKNSNSAPKISEEAPLDEIFPVSEPDIEIGIIHQKNIQEDALKIKMNFTPTRRITKERFALSLKKIPDIESKTQEFQAEPNQIDNDAFGLAMKTPSTSSRKSHKSKLKHTLSNSDIEDSKLEHIQQFTPRTWRMRVRLIEKENVEDTCNNSEDVIVVDESPEKIISPKLKSIENSPCSISSSSEKRQMKVAPLFMIKSKKSEQAALLAKKQFLYSGSPSTIKKTIVKQSSISEIVLNIFPKISHVQQRITDKDFDVFWDLPNTSLCITERDIDSSIEMPDDTITIGTFTECKSVIHTPLKQRQLHAPPVKIQNAKQLIQELKNESTNFPVFKIFRLLCEKCDKKAPNIIATPKIAIPKHVKEVEKRKRGRPKKNKEIVLDDTSIVINDDTTQKVDIATVESCMWTEKYKPQSQDDIIGNSSSVNELKSWLGAWLTYSEDQKSRKRKRMNSNSSDDFCSDSSTRDTDTTPQNTIILTGPHGSGKTASVYALSIELNINVIEINASSKRTGKKILNELQEATQSHQVKNTESKTVGSFFQSKDKNEEDSNKKLSLLLVEDIDIVFEDLDDGFLSALTTLATTSKRPMIFTTTDPNSSYLQKFISQYRVLIFSPLSANIMGTWLQILCLVENVQVNKTNIARLLQWNKGDIRKTILQLQFWAQTGGDQLKVSENNSLLPRIAKISTHASVSRRNSMEFEVMSQDDSSNLSWLSSETNLNIESRDSNYKHESVLDSFVSFYERDKKKFQISYPVNLGTIWWNLPNILNISQPQQKIVYEAESQNFSSQIEASCDDTYCSQERVQSPILFQTQDVGNRVDSSLGELKQVQRLMDSMAFADTVYTRLKVDCDFEPTVNYWQIYPSNSLSLSENFSSYDASNNLSMEIVHWLLENNINDVHKDVTECDINEATPSPDKIRRRTKQHSTMEELLVLIPTSYILDRRVICEDYQPILRLISRIEVQRFIKNNKRKSRFYHYLKNLNLHLSDTTNLILCNSLAIDKHTF